MSNSIYDFLQLVLTSFLKFIPDNMYKGLELSRYIVEESFKLFSYDKPNGCVFNFLLILLLII